MSRFAYNGELPPHEGFMILQGPCRQINLPKKDGTWETIMAPDQVHGFTLGADIGADITDERSLRVLRADVRFTQLS